MAQPIRTICVVIITLLHRFNVFPIDFIDQEQTLVMNLVTMCILHMNHVRATILLNSECQVLQVRWGDKSDELPTGVSDTPVGERRCPNRH